MTSKTTPSDRVAELLDALLMSTDDDERIGAELVQFENCSDKAIQDACHRARHFIADRDLHERDAAYARQQRSIVAEEIRQMRRRAR